MPKDTTPDFASFVSQLPPPPTGRTVDIDVSDFAGQPEGTTVFTLAELDIAQTYRIREVAQKVQEKNPELPFDLCASVAMLASAHVAPKTTQASAPLYVSLAQKNGDMFAHLDVTFRQAFARRLTAEESEKKAYSASVSVT